jgi:phospholipid/cholesterol/gamma-HCH transport system substrate-binding protein
MSVQTEAKVGLAVILAASLLVLFLGRVERWTTRDQQGMRVKASFDNVAGLEVKSAVQIAGVQVGEVEAIGLEDSHALVTIRLLPKVTIYQGARASVRAAGLLGEKYLEISPGDAEKGPLPEGAVIPQQAGSGDIDRLITHLNSIAEDIRTVSSTLRDVLGSEQGKSDLTEIVANTRDFTRNLNTKGAEIMDRLNAIFVKIDTGEGTVGKLVNDPALYEELQSTLDDVKGLMADIRGGDGTIGKLMSDPALYDRLENAAAGVEEITRKINEGEGTIGKLINDDTTVKSINQAAESIGELGGRASRLRVDVTFRNEFQFDTDDSKGYFSLKLTPREKRSYIVELVDDPLGKVSDTVSTVTTGGTTTVTHVFDVKRRLTFSAMFEQRLGTRLAVHGGLMENTAGIGANYLPAKYLTLLVDAWDFNSVRPLHDSAHVKATARLRIGPYVFVQGGLDDFLNDQYDTAFAGAGLTFEDEDLKYLLGTAASALH